MFSGYIFEVCLRHAKNPNPRVVSHKIHPGRKIIRNYTVAGLCFTAFCIKYEVTACKILSCMPLEIIYYNRYQRINIHASACGSSRRMCFRSTVLYLPTSLRDTFSLDSLGIPLFDDSSPLHSRLPFAEYLFHNQMKLVSRFLRLSSGFQFSAFAETHT